MLDARDVSMMQPENKAGTGDNIRSTSASCPSYWKISKVT